MSVQPNQVFNSEVPMAWFIKNREEKKIVANETLWLQCPQCKKHIFQQDWNNNHRVCPQCDFHDKLSAYERIGITLDTGTFQEFNETITPCDPLQFADEKESYRDKVEKTKKKTQLNEAVVTGKGTIHAIPVYLAVMDFNFLGGSLGSGTGEKILATANASYEHKTPLVVISTSGGARMHEGILSLMQMAKICAGIARLNEKNIPYISVLTNPTTGGVTASYAMVGDVNIAEPHAVIGFAGKRVIEQTIRHKLPDNFQTSEFVFEHGFLDGIVHRKNMKSVLFKILSFYNR